MRHPAAAGKRENADQQQAMMDLHTNSLSTMRGMPMHAAR
jgi:hypothetical protein